MSNATHRTRIVGFMPTPFSDDDRINGGQVRDLANKLASGGVVPAVLGGMGEYYTLSRSESRDCMSAAVEGANGSPVVAGIGWATREAVEIATDAHLVGVDTIVVNPPHYAAPSPRAYAEHVRRVTDAAQTGAVVYSAKHFPMADAYIAELVAIDLFRGVKEEHYSPEATIARVQRWGDRVEWWGVGEVNGSLYGRVGASVVTTSLANFRPDLAVRAITALVDGSSDAEAVSAATAWSDLLASDVDGAPAFLTEVMHQLAGWSRAVRLPLLSSELGIRTAVADFLAAWSTDVVAPLGGSL